MKISMDYQIVAVDFVVSRSRALAKLAKEVNDAIAAGWEPLGGIAVHDAVVMQAMIKRR